MKADKKAKGRITRRVLTGMLVFIMAFTMIPVVTGIQLQANAVSAADVCYYDNSWSDWTTTVPDGSIPYESRTEYRYKDKSTTSNRTNTSPGAGWVYDRSVLDSSWTWGAWSSYSRTAVSAYEYTTSKREVQTQNVAATYTTQYNYSRWASNSNNTGTLGPCKGTWSGVYCQYYFERGWGAKLEVSSTQYSNQMGGNFNLYGNNQWFNETSKQVQTAAAYTNYRYRDGTKGYTYYYYKWGDWSGWQASAVSSSSSRQVETRTTYRTAGYVGHSWDRGKVTRAAKYYTPGVKTYTCSHCGSTKNANIPKLNPAPVTPARAKIVSAKVKSKKVTVKWNRIKAKTKGYQVAVKNKKTQKVTYYKVKASSKSKITKTLKLKKGTYAVMVRAYNVINGETIYGKWSNVKVGKVK